MKNNTAVKTAPIDKSMMNDAQAKVEEMSIPLMVENKHPFYDRETILKYPEHLLCDPDVARIPVTFDPKNLPDVVTGTYANEVFSFLLKDYVRARGIVDGDGYLNPDMVELGVVTGTKGDIWDGSLDYDMIVLNPHIIREDLKFIINLFRDFSQKA